MTAILRAVAVMALGEPSFAFPLLKNPPKDVSLLWRPLAASLKNIAALLADGLVRELSCLPPETLLLGLSPTGWIKLKPAFCHP